MSYPPPPAPPYPPPSSQPQGGYPPYLPQQPYPGGYQQPEEDGVYAPENVQGGTYSNNEFAASPFSDKAIRRRFIGKVYTILAVQLFVTACIVAVFTLVKPVRTWVQHHTWFYYLAYAVFFATYIALACCESVRRKFPGNFIALGIFTLALSYMAGTMAAMYSVNSVLVCVGITFGICVVVTIAAMCCPCDITKCQLVIFFLSILLFIFGIAVAITYAVTRSNNQTLYAVYGGIAAVVFCIYLAFDTQMIMGGRKHELSPEEYIYGAMQLYVDVVNLFLILLSLMGVASND